ncbi:TPA: hypothetical protein ACIZ2B_002141, partial [Streptococcus agalactiae]
QNQSPSYKPTDNFISTGPGFNFTCAISLVIPTIDIADTPIPDDAHASIVKQSTLNPTEGHSIN